MPVANGKTAGWGMVGPVTLYVSSKKAPSTADWDEYMEWFRRNPMRAGNVVRSVVYDRSPGPNAAQRKLLNSVTANCEMHVAVLSPSALVRGAVTAMNWFKAGYKAFAPEEFDRGIDFIYTSDRGERLPVPEDTRKEIRRLMYAIASELDGEG